MNYEPGKFGYKWQKLDKFMYQDRWKPEDPFSHYGDPNGVKWSARMYIDQAVANGAELIDRAKVSRVIIEDKTAVGVEFTRNGRSMQAFAPKVIVSAGGIGSAVILRSSGVKRAGYDYFFDPLIGVRGIVDDINVPANEIPMSAGVHMEDEGCMMADMSHLSAMTALFAAEVFRFGQMFSRRRTLQRALKRSKRLSGQSQFSPKQSGKSAQYQFPLP